MNYWYIIAGGRKNIKTGLFFVFFVLCITCMGQQQYNLVPNYSFEQYTNCPYNLANLWNDKPDYWYKPDLRGARYFNACANGYDYNYNGMPVNFWGGGRIINTHVQVMVMLFYFIIMVWIQEIIYR